MKKCPFCAEEIQDEAVVCRYCGRELEPEIPPEDRTKCPYCAEWIRAEAIVCRYCGHELIESIPSEERKKCPFCAEWIISNTLVCQFCGREISEQALDLDTQYDEKTSKVLVAPSIEHEEKPVPNNKSDEIPIIVMEMLRELRNERPSNRKAAIRRLSEFAQKYEPVWDALEEAATSDSKSFIRAEAGKALGIQLSTQEESNIGADSAQVTEILLELKSEFPSQRRVACRKLIKFIPANQRAYKALVEISKSDKSFSVRELASKLIKSVDVDEAKAVIDSDSTKNDAIHVKQRNKVDEEGVKKKPPSIFLRSVLIGLLIAVIAALPRLSQMIEYFSKAPPGYSTPWLQGLQYDLLFHFISNLIVWSVVVAIIIAIWRNLKRKSN